MSEQNNLQESYTPSLYRLIFSRWKLILVVFILVALLGTGLSIYKNKTTYVASKSLMLITRMEDSGVGSDGVNLDNAVTDDIIEDVFAHIKSSKYSAKVNEFYNLSGAEKVSSGSVSVKAGTEDSFIFTISYRASDAKTAQEKLDYIIAFANEYIPEYEISTGFGQQTIKQNFFEYHSVADSIILKQIQYDANVKVSNNLSRNVAITIIISLVLGFAVAFVFGCFDNRMIDKDELEALTGVSLLTFIEDSDMTDGKRTKKNKNN